MSEHFSKVPTFGPETVYVAPDRDTMSLDTETGALKTARWSTNRISIDHHRPEIVDVHAFASGDEDFVSVSFTSNLMRKDDEPCIETDAMLTQEQAVEMARAILAKVEAKQQEVPA